MKNAQSSDDSGVAWNLDTSRFATQPASERAAFRLSRCKRSGIRAYRRHKDTANACSLAVRATNSRIYVQIRRWIPVARSACLRLISRRSGAASRTVFRNLLPGIVLRVPRISVKGSGLVPGMLEVLSRLFQAKIVVRTLTEPLFGLMRRKGPAR